MVLSSWPFVFALITGVSFKDSKFILKESWYLFLPATYSISMKYHLISGNVLEKSSVAFSDWPGAKNVPLIWEKGVFPESIEALSKDGVQENFVISAPVWPKFFNTR